MKKSHGVNLPTGWVAEVAACKSFAQLKAKAVDLAALIGMSNVTYSMWLPGDRRSTYFTDYPHAWVEHYLDNNYADVDPVLRAGLLRPGHRSTWSDLLRLDLSEAERLPLNAARDFGLIEGALIGVGGHHSKGLFGCTVEGSEAERRDLLAANEQAFAALAAVVHEKARALLLAAVPIDDLTATERDLLRFLGTGLPPDIVGNTLHMSDREFQDHISRILHKLGTDAVQLAVARVALQEAD